jgi:hypothetical protein
MVITYMIDKISIILLVIFLKKFDLNASVSETCLYYCSANIDIAVGTWVNICTAHTDTPHTV